MQPVDMFSKYTTDELLRTSQSNHVSPESPVPRAKSPWRVVVWYWNFWKKIFDNRTLFSFWKEFAFPFRCIIQSQGDLDGVLPSFSRSLKINMAAAIGVHLGYTCASLAIYKVENQLLWNDLFIFFGEKHAVIHFVLYLRMGERKSSLMMQETGSLRRWSRVLEKIWLVSLATCIFWIAVDNSSDSLLSQWVV